jgi:hypothetical protein
MRAIYYNYVRVSPQSSLHGNYDVCQCFNCKDYQLNSSNNKTRLPAVGLAPGMHPSTARTSPLYNSLPYDTPRPRESITEKHDTFHHHPSFTPSHEPPAIRGKYFVHPHDDNPTGGLSSSFSLSRRVGGATQVLTDELEAIRNLPKSYHDRLKSRTCDLSTEEMIHSSTNIFRDRDDIELYESEEKIQAIQRILRVAKAQHESLVKDRLIGRY